MNWKALKSSTILVVGSFLIAGLIAASAVLLVYLLGNVLGFIVSIVLFMSDPRRDAGDHVPRSAGRAEGVAA